MCRIIVECSTITGSTAYSASGILVKTPTFLKKQTEIGRGCHREGGTSRGQSTVLLKNVVPRRGGQQVVFSFNENRTFNGIFRRQTVPQNIAPESQIQPERNCMLQELFIDIFL